MAQLQHKHNSILKNCLKTVGLNVHNCQIQINNINAKIGIIRRFPPIGHFDAILGPAIKLEHVAAGKNLPELFSNCLNRCSFVHKHAPDGLNPQKKLGCQLLSSLSA